MSTLLQPVEDLRQRYVQVKAEVRRLPAELYHLFAHNVEIPTSMHAEPMRLRHDGVHQVTVNTRRPQHPSEQANFKNMKICMSRTLTNPSRRQTLCECSLKTVFAQSADMRENGWIVGTTSRVCQCRFREENKTICDIPFSCLQTCLRSTGFSMRRQERVNAAFVREKKKQYVPSHYISCKGFRTSLSRPAKMYADFRRETSGHETEVYSDTSALAIVPSKVTPKTPQIIPYSPVQYMQQ